MGKLVGDDDDFDFDNYDLMMTKMNMAAMTMLTMCQLTNDDADGLSVFNSLCEQGWCQGAPAGLRTFG